jgi:IS30 family transposase
MITHATGDTVTQVSIEQAAKLTGKHRSTITRHIKAGKLSKADKGIDTAELIRVYGELKNSNESRNDAKTNDSLSEREKILLHQIESLEKDKVWFQDRIVNLENRLDAPKKFRLW